MGVTALARCFSLDGLAVGCVVLLFGLIRCIGFCDWNLPSTRESRGGEQERKEKECRTCVSTSGITTKSVINHTCIPDMGKTVPSVTRYIAHDKLRALHTHTLPHTICPPIDGAVSFSPFLC